MNTENGTQEQAQGGVLRLVDAGTVLLRVLSTSVALLGLLVTPGLQLVLVLPAAATAYLLAAGCGRYLMERWPQRRVPLTVATAVGGTIPFSHGVDLLGPVGTGIGLTVVVLILTSTFGWVERFGTAPVTTTEPDASWQDLVQVLPLGMLLSEWRSLEQRLREDPDPPAGLRHAHALVLQEVSARDPAVLWRDSGQHHPPPVP